MRNVNVQALTGPEKTTKNGVLIDANQLVSISFHAVFSDTDGAGVFKLQASDDITTQGGLASTVGFAPTNWVDIPSQTATITGGTAAILTIPQCAYRWLRAVWTASNSGDGTITVNMNALGV